MDAFAISIASGVAITNLKLKHAVTIGAWFGFFQFFMPIIGWGGGCTLVEFISAFDHWIVFGILGFLGCKMIYEALHLEEFERKTDPLDIRVLLVLSMATSVDALAVGFSIAVMKVALLLPVIMIGAITFLMCVAGVYIGSKAGHFFERKMEVVGGVVLILLGLKILVEHLVKDAC